MDPYAGFEPSVGEIAAVRTFRIGRGGTLCPLFSDEAWEDGANEARCRNVPPGAVALHPAPDPGCTCGFYAYGSEAAVEYRHERHVLAVVSFWGRVIAGTRGLRAEHGRVEALWLSETVPAELAARVARRYPSVALYRDRAAMLAEHPPTPLDCYEPMPAARRPWSGRWWSAAALSLAVASTLPADWLGGVAVAQWTDGVAFFLLMIAAVALGWRRPDDPAVPRRRLFLFAVALWTVAPFGGTLGVLFLRLPLLEVAVLTAVQWARVVRAARRFPADVD
jgi:hypothetical protein